jgi:hypothetical protein
MVNDVLWPQKQVLGFLLCHEKSGGSMQAALVRRHILTEWHVIDRHCCRLNVFFICMSATLTSGAPVCLKPCTLTAYSQRPGRRCEET